MYKCYDCEAKFEYAFMKGNSEVCPNCESEDITCIDTCPSCGQESKCPIELCADCYEEITNELWVLCKKYDLRRSDFIAVLRQWEEDNW